MSIFNEILSKINTLTTETNKNFEDDLKNVFESLEKFEREYLSSKVKQRELAAKSKNALKPLQSLQSINEDEDESKKTPDQKQTTKPETKKVSTDSKINNNNHDILKEKPSRNKKRSKDQVEDMHSPEQDKRPKRGASVRAQSNISRQVNQNLTQKLRRDESEQESRPQKEQDSDKENTLPLQIKQEKLSLPPEPMEIDMPQDIQVKQEVNKDDVAMPPPTAPVPKRGRAAKNKQKETANESTDESEGKRKSSRTRKQTEPMPPPPVPSKRSSRASSRASARTHTDEPRTHTDEPRTHTDEPRTHTHEPPAPDAARPKRTRTKKVPSQSSQESEDTAASASTSPAPRPKRTRRGKAAEKQQKPESPKLAELPPKQERISVPEPLRNQNVVSPILVLENITTKNLRVISEQTVVLEKDDVHLAKANLEETRVISGGVLKEGAICDFDKTVILPNGKYDHVSSTPKAMNETVVITKDQRGTITLTQPTNTALDATVVIEKAPPRSQAINMTDDNSLMTDDSDDNNLQTPPANLPKSKEQPLSAVKEKVQQFEEMANRVTRTKTRAMAKKEESTENHTPPDKISKVILTADTLTKMNGLIFNGKAPQISSSATKPNIIKLPNTKSLISSASKIPVGRKDEDRKSKAALGRKEDDARTKEREDARKKKEAILEAKREYNKRKREEKMAAAAAARSAAERERQLALEAAARDKNEKQAHADMNKQERLLEAEKKKLELNRKAAETEERRRAEERARALRLAEEQRAHTARTKQIEESLASKKEAVILAKEIEKRQKEYIEKQKLKQKMEADKAHTPLRSPRSPPRPPAVHMADGFELLHSDSDDDDKPARVPPPWATHKARCQRLKIQYYIKPEHIDRLFSVRVHSPDLVAIFPRIERRYLKRTSSAVWRTPPHRAHY